MTPAQLAILKTKILAETDATFAALRASNETGAMANWLNELASPTYTVALPNVQTDAIGRAINYVAYEAMTIANRDKLLGFLQLNPRTFDGTRSDVRAMLSADTATGIFSGTLGGQGASTRAALLALMVRAATRAEKWFSTGDGTTASPSISEFLGTIENDNVISALNA